MSIENISAKLRSMQALKGYQEQGAVQGKPANVNKGDSFLNAMNSAIKEVDGMQKEADQQIEGLTLGKEGFSTHNALIALEKADVAFQLMSSIRSKIVRAYEDVMRTQV